MKKIVSTKFSSTRQLQADPSQIDQRESNPDLKSVPVPQGFDNVRPTPDSVSDTNLHRDPNPSPTASRILFAYIAVHRDLSGRAYPQRPHTAAAMVPSSTHLKDSELWWGSATRTATSCPRVDLEHGKISHVKTGDDQTRKLYPGMDTKIGSSS